MLPETEVSPKPSLFLKLNSAFDRVTFTVSGCEQNLRSKSSKSPRPPPPPPTPPPRPTSAPSQSKQSGAQLTIRYANSFPKYCNSLSQRITGLRRCSRRANRAECLRETVPLGYFCQRSGHAPFAELSPGSPGSNLRVTSRVTRGTAPDQLAPRHPLSDRRVSANQRLTLRVTRRGTAPDQLILAIL